MGSEYVSGDNSKIGILGRQPFRRMGFNWSSGLLATTPSFSETPCKRLSLWRSGLRARSGLKTLPSGNFQRPGVRSLLCVTQKLACFFAIFSSCIYFLLFMIYFFRFSSKFRHINIGPHRNGLGPNCDRLTVRVIGRRD